MPADLHFPPGLVVDEPEWANELDEAIIAGSELPEESRRWRVTDLASAEWAMSKLARLGARAAEVEQQYKVWLSRLDFWRTDMLRPLEWPTAMIESKLEVWGIEQRRDNPEIATLHLPSGDVATVQHVDPKVVIVNEDEVIRWVEDSLDPEVVEAIVNITKSVRLKELRKHVRIEDNGAVVNDETKAVVPGVIVEWPSITATVKPS